MRPNFRTGQLQACPDLLAAIPRPVVIAAILRHATTSPVPGPIRTEHRHGATRFVLETDEDRRSTVLWLSEGSR